jgi:hypothetical protein
MGKKIVAPWSETKWLTVSSFFFMIPAIYSYQKGLYDYSALLFLTAIVSANFWRSAKYDWRRNADLFCSRLCFIVFFYNGVFSLNYLPYILIGYPMLFIIGYCYYMSNYLHKNDTEPFRNIKKKNFFINEWWHYHIIFHICLVTEQMMILNIL